MQNTKKFRRRIRALDDIQILGGAITGLIAIGGALFTAFGVVMYFWKYIQLTADLEGPWVYPLAITIIFGSLLAVFWTARWAWCKVLGDADEVDDAQTQHQAEGSEAELLKQKRLMKKEERAVKEQDQR